MNFYIGIGISASDSRRFEVREARTPGPFSSRREREDKTQRTQRNTVGI